MGREEELAELEGAEAAVAFASGMAAVSTTLLGLLTPGDHVVAPYPAYQQLYSVPRALGCDVSLWKIRPETGFSYDVADLERLVRADTKLIVINTPHNPTGYLMERAVQQELARLAARQGFIVFSDEVYRLLVEAGLPNS